MLNKKIIISLTSIFAIILVTGASCNTQNLISEKEIESSAEQNNQYELYKNNKYGFSLTTTKECLNVLKAEQSIESEMIFNVTAPLAQKWPKNTPYYSYSIEEKSIYDAKPEEFGGKGLMVANLKNNYVLIVVPPQDRPDTVENCEINANTF